MFQPKHKVKLDEMMQMSRIGFLSDPAGKIPTCHLPHNSTIRVSEFCGSS